MFLDMDDDYMRGRAADVKDVSERLIRILSGKAADCAGASEEPAIILATDLAPSETVQLDKDKVLQQYQHFVGSADGMVMQQAALNEQINRETENFIL